MRESLCVRVLGETHVKYRVQHRGDEGTIRKISWVLASLSVQEVLYIYSNSLPFVIFMVSLGCVPGQSLCFS